MMALSDDLDMRGLRGRLRENEPLSRHTAWGIGGPADRLYRPADLDDLCAFLTRVPRTEPLFWLGLGSNLLVRDGGIRGTVIHLGNTLSHQSLIAPRVLRAEAGVACPKVARFAARSDLRGAEFMAGIPGTIGGALAMNAGAFGGETYDIVSEVETVDRGGELRIRPADAFDTGYRHVAVPAGEWFVAARFALERGVQTESEARIRELLRTRSETQPLRQRSCGSVFRNPPGDHAARLIEASGLKGEREGGAEVSTKHANFIINADDATAAQVEALINRVMERVEHDHGVVLVPEVRVVGDPV